MAKEEIERIVIEQVAEVVNIHLCNFTIDDNLNDFEIGDVDKIEIARKLEQKFGIIIDIVNSIEQNWQTVRDIVDCVKRLV